MTAAEPVTRPGYQAPQPASARDPVCGMTVDRAETKHRAEHAGHGYVFCSARCREKFIADPARYVGAVQDRGATGAAIGEVLWTCPMHPQICLLYTSPSPRD